MIHPTDLPRDVRGETLAEVLAALTELTELTSAAFTDADEAYDGSTDAGWNLARAGGISSGTNSAWHLVAGMFNAHQKAQFLGGAR